MLTEGSTIGPYRIQSLLRDGPDVALYRAAQPGLGRTVAVYLTKARAGSPEATRFTTSARALAALDHPGVLPVYEVEEVNGQPFVAIRDVTGERLDDVLARGPLPAARVADLAAQLAPAAEAIAKVTGPLGELLAGAVVVADDGRAYLDPVTATTASQPRDQASNEDDASTVRAFAALFSSMTAPDAPPALSDVLARARHEPESFATPRALADAALSTVGPARTQRRFPPRVLVLGVAMIAAVGLILAVILSGDSDNAETPGVNARVGRIVATIPLGEEPARVIAAAGRIWVVTGRGNVVRIDPRRNEIVGEPLRFRSQRDLPVGLLGAGAGTVWVAQGRGELLRLNTTSGRVTGRVRLGGTLIGGTVRGDIVWVTRATKSRNELLRIDGRRLRILGRPTPVGFGPYDIEASGGRAWVNNVQDGTLTSVDTVRARARTIRIGGQTLDVLLRDDVLWVADAPSGTVTRFAPDRLELASDTAVRAGHPFALLGTKDAVWLLATARFDPNAPARLYRIDPRSGKLAGRPLDLRTTTRGLAAAGGVLWIASLNRRAILKVVPTFPPPAARPAPRPRSPATLLNGPLPQGRVRALAFEAPFEITVRERGWMAFTNRTNVRLFSVDHPETNLDLSTHRRVFGPDGQPRPLHSADDFLRAVESNRKLRVTPRREVKLGGVPTIQVTLRVLPHDDWSRELCLKPCVPLFPVERGTGVEEVGSPSRYTVLERSGVPVVISETERPGEPRRFAATGRLLSSLRFR